jgi:multicomponent Na+:H+ antiporter subunit C
MENGLHQFQLYAVAAALLFWIGFHGVVARRELLKKIIAVNIMGGGVFLLLVAIARRNWADAADPVPHAMVLTGIVVALSATALALALARRIAELELRNGEEDDSP